MDNQKAYKVSIYTNSVTSMDLMLTKDSVKGLYDWFTRDGDNIINIADTSGVTISVVKDKINAVVVGGLMVKLNGQSGVTIEEVEK